jgi:hypothetical protein
VLVIHHKDGREITGARRLLQAMGHNYSNYSRLV